MPISQTRRRELVAEVFGGQESPLRSRLAAWLDGSPRLAEFVAQHRDKLRKKLRVAQGAEGRLDVLAEVAVARRLLVDRRCEVSYEPLLAGGGRGPDFVVAFRVNTRFAVEVARLRAAAEEPLAGRIAGVAGAKLAQCQPSMPNVVALVLESAAADAAAPVVEAGARLITLASGTEPDYLARRGFRDAADFRHQFQRLSALWRLDGPLGDPVAPAHLWANPRARHPLPGPVAALLAR